MTSCSFDKHGQTLIIFSQQHQHTSENDMLIQLYSSLYFYLHYLLLNNCDGNDSTVGGCEKSWLCSVLALIKISPRLSKLQLSKVPCVFLRHSV